MESKYCVCPKLTNPTNDPNAQAASKPAISTRSSIDPLTIMSSKPQQQKKASAGGPKAPNPKAKETGSSSRGKGSSTTTKTTTTTTTTTTAAAPAAVSAGEVALPASATATATSGEKDIRDFVETLLDEMQSRFSGEPKSTALASELCTCVYRWRLVRSRF